MKANRKLTFLAWVRTYLDIDNTRTLFHAFSQSQFKFCPFTWMFCSRTANNRIIESTIHMRALRLVCNDYDLSLVKLLTKDRSFTVHDYNIPAIQMFKL